MKLFFKEEVNTKRQFEFDLAKAICILGMVFVHCFEEMAIADASSSGNLYYIVTTILNALFGAGTFMTCLGIGLAYTKHNKPSQFIKRGLFIFLTGYLLNLLRFAIPSCSYFLYGEVSDAANYVLGSFLYTDIMQFAGLTFMLFGLLKKLKVPDWGITLIAVVMSIFGSFYRLIETGSYWSAELLGLFVGTVDKSTLYNFYAPFPILNWFIFPVLGYLFGKLIKRCNNTDKFYAISTPITGVIVLVYMLIAIPNKFGMMCGDEMHYFQMITPDAFIVMSAALFVYGLYHFISKLFNEKFKNFIIKQSVNINRTYCIHWIIIGWLSTIIYLIYPDGISIYIVAVLAVIIFIVSTVLGEQLRKHKEKKALKNETVQN